MVCKVAIRQDDYKRIESEYIAMRQTLQELYQSATILNNTSPEVHITVWAINLEKHQRDLELARLILASTTFALTGGNGPGPDRPGQGGEEEAHG